MNLKNNTAWLFGPSTFIWPIYVQTFPKYMCDMRIQITAVEMGGSTGGWKDRKPMEKNLKFLNNY